MSGPRTATLQPTSRSRACRQRVLKATQRTGASRPVYQFLKRYPTPEMVSIIEP